MTSTRIGRRWRKLGYLVMANWLVFWGVGVYLGGTASDRSTEGGRYYLANQGRETEVSKAVYIYSKWHERLSIAGLAVFFMGSLFLWNEMREPRRSRDGAA